MTEPDIEAHLSQSVAEFRADHGLGTFWDEELGHLLGQCVWTYEMQKLGGGTGEMDLFHVG